MRNTWLWPLTAVVLFALLVVQSDRLRGVPEILEDEIERARVSEATARAFKGALLRYLSEAEPAGAAMLPRDGWLMIVAERCEPSKAAMTALAGREARLNLHVGAFGTTLTTLENLVEESGLRTPAGIATMDDVPGFGVFDHVTPLYFEFRGGEIVDIHVGRPKDVWLQ